MQSPVLCNRIAKNLLNSRYQQRAFRINTRNMSIDVHNHDERTYRTQLSFDVGNRKLQLNTVFQDLAPFDRPLATVIAVHGSPGSHRDFKYITPYLEQAGLRFIGVNYPGFGLTQDSEDVLHTNEERNAFVQALMNRLGIKERIVFLSHSRGSENALEMAVRNSNNCIGLALVNPFGLRLNKAIRPRTRIDNIRYYHENYPWLRGPMEFVLYHMYNRLIGLHLKTGRIAVNAIKSLTNLQLDEMGKTIKQFNESDLSLFLCYSGKDHLIETEISEEFASRFNGLTHKICSDSCDESAIGSEVEWELSSIKPGRISIALPDDSHFAQKKRAQLIARGVIAMVKGTTKASL